MRLTPQTFQHPTSGVLVITNKQADLLNLETPVKSGWLNHVVGREVPTDFYRDLVAAATWNQNKPRPSGNRWVKGEMAAKKEVARGQLAFF